MRSTALALAILTCASLPAAAQVYPRQAMVGGSLPFSDDTQGYGANLLALMAPRLAQFAKEGAPVRIMVAQVSLIGGNPQPSFAVRLEGLKTCDARFGCEVMIFTWSGTDWVSVLSTKANAMALGVPGPTGMVSVIVDGERWDWNGKRYDVGG